MTSCNSTHPGFQRACKTVTGTRPGCVVVVICMLFSLIGQPGSFYLEIEFLIVRPHPAGPRLRWNSLEGCTMAGGRTCTRNDRAGSAASLMISSTVSDPCAEETHMRLQPRIPPGDRFDLLHENGLFGMPHGVMKLHVVFEVALRSRRNERKGVIRCRPRPRPVFTARPVIEQPIRPFDDGLRPFL